MLTQLSSSSPLLLLLLLLLLVSSSTPSFLAHAQPSPPANAFLNAYRAPLSAHSAPLSHYFLEFPLDHDDATGGSQPTTRPRCEDGSPFGLLFRRGTDEHYRKLLVEFEGAGGTRAFASSTPWESLRSGSGDGRSFFPPLGTCRGFSEGFLSSGAELLGFGSGNEDRPICLRDEEDSDATDADVADNIGNSTNGSFQERGDGDANDVKGVEGQQEHRHRGEAWWELLGGDRSSVRDWSYLLVPHCTPAQSSLLFANVREATARVSSWYEEEEGGLDALVVASGGLRIGGGCGSTSLYEKGAMDNFSALSFAKDVVNAAVWASFPSPWSSKALVVMDGAAAWNRGGGVTWRSPSYGDATLSDLMRETLASDRVEVAWTSSGASAVGAEEDAFLRMMAQSYRDSFHVHRPSSAAADDVTREPNCPRYALSDASADDAFVDFVRKVVKGMPWSSDDDISLEVRNNNVLDNDTLDDDKRLSFLSIFLILLGGYLASWAAYLAIKARRSSSSDAASTTPSPHDLWFLALTKFPVLFLLVSLTIPVVLSCIAFQRDGVSVNLDFDSYLDIDTKEERTATQFKALVEHQKESLEEEEGICRALYRGYYPAYDSPTKGQERRVSSTEEAGEDEGHDPGRRRGLQEFVNREGRSVVSLFYQNRNGGTVFTPDVLRSIHEFETFLMTEVPGLDKFCVRILKECQSFDSIIPYFFPDGENLVEDVDGVLRLFPGSMIALAKMDKYFSEENLGSNITLTHIMLNDVGGVQLFLETLHRVLWEVDQSGKYPELIISWSNSHMQKVEAADALEHDSKWSLAALAFIGLMVFVKVHNVFEVLAGVLGLVLSFTSALYWQHHFDFQQLTVMHVAGIFVMLGIGADDIFLTIDSFEHTKVDFANSQRNLDDPEILKRRMILSYGTAGSMLLVSSVTTAICFFSNVLSALVAIADFGSYMGMVVVLNYVHVMTILPSAIIVYEVHIKPLQPKSWRAVCCCLKKRDGEESRVPSTHEILDAETGIVLSESAMASSNHENGEVKDRVAVIRASSNSSIQAHEGFVCVTGGISSSSPIEDDWQDNDRSGRTRETISHSASDTTHQETEALQQMADDYKFLDHTEEMSALDRYFVQRHAPFVFAWRKTIVFTSIFVAITMGILAWLNFKLYDGTIIMFKEQYNLGRVQRITDEYFAEALVRKYTDEGVDFSGGDGDVSVSAGDLDNTLDESEIFDVPAGFNSVGGPASNAGGGSSANPPPTTSKPSASPTTAAPITSSPSISVPTVPGPTISGSTVTGLAPIKVPDIQPLASPVEETKYSCPSGVSAIYCIQTGGVTQTYQKREYYSVSIVWGMMPTRSDPNVWVVREKNSQYKNEVMKEALGDTVNSNYIDPSDPFIQEWLLEMVTMARNDTALRLHPQLTWIEAIKAFAAEKGIGFPIPKSMFIGVIELMKTQSRDFRKLVEKEIATKKPGIKGEFLYTGLTVLSEVPVAYTSDLALKDWTNFTNSFNEMLPENLPPTDAQSNVFIDSLRTTAIVDSTVTSYFFANGLYVAIMLFFTGNLLLTLMVMLSLLLILLAFAGLTFFAFQIEFGPVESLGVSIFVGLSANYLLHIAHSYHKSNIKERNVKIQRAVFITGSPILWSALSTIGGSLFLFACRTWLLTELGLLICTIIGLSLMCSVGFLLALLAFIGPLPIGHKLHSCDLMVVFRPCCLWERVQQAGRAERDLEINPAEAERDLEIDPAGEVNDLENSAADVKETEGETIE